MQPLPGPIYVTVGNTRTGTLGYTWRIWASRTSFYLKARAADLSYLKLSLHGEDPRHPRGGGFKFAMDDEERYSSAIAEGRILSSRSGQWPIWFPGKRINDDVTLVARLCWTWDACTRLGPPPPPGNLRRDATGLVAPGPPEPGDAIDVDDRLAQPALLAPAATGYEG